MNLSVRNKLFLICVIPLVVLASFFASLSIILLQRTTGEGVRHNSTVPKK